MLDQLPYCVAVKPVSLLIQSEMVSEEDVRLLAAAIRAAGKWTKPIPIDRQTGIVMDGNHRLKVAGLLGLNFLPCVPLDYQDPRVFVSHWRSGSPFSLESIGRRILQERVLFPYKTTRHSFAPALPRTEIPLTLLAGGSCATWT
ncbi:ParB N-terminal domain-containing protein [Paraburkholderia strydomiana]|uniref:transcriptional regulator n=1 Tax=Paraburkholderia strydomiana TaxID=1245417 RepID=UPI00286665A7|nr:transcriptional regulator [Paraburkholderia strydomiana]MDR7010036.1 hypothetical protein [Paraburkholderia strydomiana]